MQNKLMIRAEVIHAIIRREDRFLLGRRSLSKQIDSGYWATIGGRVEQGESLEAGLIRECLEEIGVKVRPIRKLTTVEDSETSHHWFDVELISGEPFLVCDENSELRWFTVEEMKLLFPIVHEEIEILRSSY